MEFDFKQDHILENEVVLLRPLLRNDKQYLVDFSIDEPEIWRYNIHGAGGLANLEKYIDTALSLREAEKHYPFIVFDKRAGKYAGMTRYYEVSNEFRRLELGFTWYGKKFQGTGLNKNAKYLLLDFAFDRLQMVRVGFGAHIDNERSINAMKSIGCKTEGLMRHYGRDAEGKIFDRIILSILKEEWEGGSKAELERQMKTFK